MKRIFITMGLLCISLAAYAQSNIYVIYTAINKGDAGIVHRKMDKFNTNVYRSAPQIFTIQNPKLNYYFKFTYMDAFGYPPNDCQQIVPSNFSQYHVIDWDAIARTLTKEQANEKVEYILSHDKIYFVDRREGQQDFQVAIPVIKMQSNF